MDMLEKIELLMKKQGIPSKMKLSEVAGIPYTTIVGLFEKGADNAKRSTLFKLAKAFDCSLDYLADDTYGDGAQHFITYGTMVNIPIVGKISCGNGSLAYEEIEGYEPTPEAWLNGGEYFYLRAKGDSMINARVFDGDLVLIRRQEDVDNGQIGVVLVEDDAFLKRVYKHDHILKLESANPTYSTIECNTRDQKCRIIGKLKKIIVNLEG